MAEKLPSDEQIADARKKEADAKKAWEDYELPVNPLTSEQNKKERLKKEWKRLEKERQTLEKPLKDTEKLLSRVRESIKQAEQAAKNPASRQAATVELNRLRGEETRLQQSLETREPYEPTASEAFGFTGSPELAAAYRRASSGTRQTTATTTTGKKPKLTDAENFATMTQEELDNYMGPVASRDINELRQIIAAGGSPTGTGGGGGRAVLTPEERKARREARKEERYAKAEQMMKQMFPQQAWLWDVDQTKFPGLRQVLLNGYKNRAWESDEGINRWLGELQNSDFYLDLRDKGTMRKITSVVGDLGFDDDNMGRLLRDAVNFDWDDDTLKLEAYKEAFRKNADGTYVHSNAEVRARKSTDYLRVQGIGTAFFNQLDNATVENVLTGNMIEDDVLRQQRELAKTKYGHLANLIDQGLTMEAITQSYRDEAARLLEVDPNTINMGDAKYQTAYDFMDASNQKRLMTTGEWVRQLRTDAQYGWDKTENAKKEARAIASSIVQAFGRVS